MRVAALVVALFASLTAAAPALAHEESGWTWADMYRGASVVRAGASAQAAQDDYPKPTTPAKCGPGSNPVPTDMTGRVPADVVASGKGDKGFTCNLELVGRHRVAGGGFKVERFVDKAGRECAYYDTTLLFPTTGQTPAQGVAVLDMSDPTKPIQTATLTTPAMQSPHESVLLNPKRGLLAAVLGQATTYPGVVDIYDLNEDCRAPVLQSSLPLGVLGHESGWSPDGNTLYATSLFTGTITALDTSNPKLPVPVWEGRYVSHGLTTSEDGNRAYLAADFGVLILDTSEIQARKPNPQVREVGRLTWKSLSIPQVAIPVTIGGKPYLVEVDEFSTNEGRFPAENGRNVGAARIIDISNEKEPKVVGNMRLEVHQPENRAAIAGDPGASGTGSFVQGYAGHYCAVPRRTEPGIVACSFIVSGLRVFDIRDPVRPREIAYYVAPFGVDGGESNYAMSAPAFAPARDEIWYSDGTSGFYALRLADGVWPSSAVKGARRRRCVDTRKFSFRLHADRGQRVLKVVVYVNGKRKLSRGGRNVRRVTLKRLPRRRFVVKIVSTQSNGTRRISTRVYKGCRKSKPRTRTIRRSSL